MSSGSVCAFPFTCNESDDGFQLAEHYKKSEVRVLDRLHTLSVFAVFCWNSGEADASSRAPPSLARKYDACATGRSHARKRTQLSARR